MLPEISRGFLKKKYLMLPNYLLLSCLPGFLVSDDSAALLALSYFFFYLWFLLRQRYFPYLRASAFGWVAVPLLPAPWPSGD